MARDVLGAELKVGDTIEVWWAGNRDTIIGLTPYRGHLTCFTEGAQLASLALLKTGMTIENGSVYRVLN